MSLPIAADPAPIDIDSEGVPRVGGTRITLSSVVWSYKEGSSVEELRREFPGLTLADLHATIAYYLRHRADVEAYLAEEETIGERNRETIEAAYSPELRDKIRRLKNRASRSG